MVLKKGLGAEGLAWSLTFLLLPLCCVYYPVSTLPEWLQWVALALPPTHVFEGLRALLLENALRRRRHADGAGAQHRLFRSGGHGVRPAAALARAGADALHADRRVTEIAHSLTISFGIFGITFESAVVIASVTVYVCSAAFLSALRTGVRDRR